MHVYVHCIHVHTAILCTLVLQLYNNVLAHCNMQLERVMTLRHMRFTFTEFEFADIVHRDLKLENVLLKSSMDSSSDKIDIKVKIILYMHIYTLGTKIQRG